MTARQIILKLIYPVWMLYTRVAGKRIKMLINEKKVTPEQSFYDLSMQQNNGQELRFETTKGKKVLLVNTASDCGYTAQYDDLQRLYQEYNDKLIILAFPANDFKEQEKGNDETIAQFCRINFGVTFPLASKSSVVKGKDQNSIFQWLSDKNKNGWNNKQPSWNFSKYLVNEQGQLTHYFDPSISPLDDVVINAIQKGE